MKKVLAYLIMLVFLSTFCYAYTEAVDTNIVVNQGLYLNDSELRTTYKEITGESMQGLFPGSNLLFDHTILSKGLYTGYGTSWVNYSIQYEGDQALKLVILNVEFPHVFASNSENVAILSTGKEYLISNAPLRYAIVFNDLLNDKQYVEFKVTRRFAVKYYDDVKTYLNAIEYEPLINRSTIPVGKNEISITTIKPFFNTTEKSTYIYDFNATQKKDNALFWYILGSQGAAAIDVNTGLLEFNPNKYFIGNKTLNVSVTDGVIETSFVWDVTVNKKENVFDWAKEHQQIIFNSMYVCIFLLIVLIGIIYERGFEIGLKPSFIYIVSDNKRKAYELFKHHLKHGRTGMLLSFEDPTKLINKFKISGKIDPYWIKRVKSQNAIEPNNVEEIANKITEFVLDYKKGIVIFDAVHVLKAHTSFSAVLKMLQNIKDWLSLEHDIIIIPLKRSHFSKKEWAILQHEFEEIHLEKKRISKNKKRFLR